MSPGEVGSTTGCDTGLIVGVAGAVGVTAGGFVPVGVGTAAGGEVPPVGAGAGGGVCAVGSAEGGVVVGVVAGG